MTERDVANICSINVQVVDWSSRKLTALPPSIGKLHHVTKLWLSANALVSLSKDFSNLTSLKELWLQENQLQAIDDVDWRMLSSLETLWLHNNRLGRFGGAPPAIARAVANKNV